jgi:hypothetical protein
MQVPLGRLTSLISAWSRRQASLLVPMILMSCFCAKAGELLPPLGSAEAFLRKVDRALQAGDKAKILTMTDTDQWITQGIAAPSVENLSLPTPPISRDSPLKGTDGADLHTVAYTDGNGEAWLLTISYRSDRSRWTIKLWGTPCRAAGVVPRGPEGRPGLPDEAPLRFILRCARFRQ